MKIKKISKFAFFFLTVAFASTTSSIFSSPVKDIDTKCLPVGSKLLRGQCTTPDGKYIYLTHTIGRFWLPVTQVERGWCNCSALSIFDAKTGAYINTVLLDDPDLGAAEPWDVAVDDNIIAVAHSGTSEISIIDRKAFEKRLAERGKENLSTDLTFMSGIRRRIPTEKQGPRKIKIQNGKVVVTQYLEDKKGITKGELLFNDARRCHQHWQSCATCHPNGNSDNLKWSFPSMGAFGKPAKTCDLTRSQITPERLYPMMLADFCADLFVDPDPEGAKQLVEYLMSMRKPVIDKRTLFASKLYNPIALKRAVEAYSKRLPELFKDKASLLSEIDAAKTPKAQEAVSHKIFFRLPELSKIEEILAIRRNNANAVGLPNNWQGNTSIPLSGYSNSIVRIKLDPKKRDACEKKVYSSTSFVGDIELDFDAQNIAFSTKSEKTKGWCVAEIPLDGPKHIKELSPTNTPYVHYYNPMYLPNGKMIFIGTVGFQGVPCVSGSDNVGSLMLRHENGNLRRLTFDQDENWYPVLTEQGRVLFSRWEYADSAHYFSRLLMTMNPDGSDQQEFYGSNSYWPNSLFYARMIPGSATKFMGIVSGHHGVRRKGQLVLFDAARSRKETEGAIQTLPGWGKKVQNKTRDQLADVICNGRYFLHPWPLSEEGALVAMQDKNLENKWFIAYVDVYDNLFPLVVAEENPSNYLQPYPLVKRQKPTLPAPRADESKTNCLVNIVSVYNGPGLKGVPKGTVKKLRVFNFEYTPLKWGKRGCGGHYVIGMEGPWDVRVILGEVDVEEDGSVFFECPANTPIAIQPLDKDGRHLQEMRSWFAGVPGETLSCIGCHERQSIASGPPRRAIATTKPPQKIKPWRGVRRGFSFAREVSNVFERRCSGCHDGAPNKKTILGKALPKLNGHPREIYDNIHPYVRRNGPEGDYHLLTPLEFHASTSPLVQILEKGHHGVRLTEEEWDRLNWWMNINVPYFGTWTETKQPHPTPIKLRRKYEKMFSGITFDPEKIVNPHVRAKFVPPDANLKSQDEAKLKNLFTAQKTDGGKADDKIKVIELPGGRKIRLRKIHAGDNLESFWMSEKEITQGDMRAFFPEFDNGVYDMHYKDQVKRGYYMDMNSEFSSPNAANFPAIRVSRDMAMDFCRHISKIANADVTLPSEAQWERACMAGTNNLFSFGDFNADWGKYANLAGANRTLLAVVGVDPKPWKNAPQSWKWELQDSRFDDGHLFLSPVGSFKPNAWGLYDMHGNVSEWTSSSDDKGAIIKGGSWNSLPTAATVKWKWSYPTWMRPYDVGFRVVISEK